MTPPSFKLEYDNGAWNLSESCMPSILADAGVPPQLWRETYTAVVRLRAIYVRTVQTMRRIVYFCVAVGLVLLAIHLSTERDLHLQWIVLVLLFKPMYWYYYFHNQLLHGWSDWVDENIDQYIPYNIRLRTIKEATPGECNPAIFSQLLRFHLARPIVVGSLHVCRVETLAVHLPSQLLALQALFDKKELTQDEFAIAKARTLQESFAVASDTERMTNGLVLAHTGADVEEQSPTQSKDDDDCIEMKLIQIT